MNLQWNGDLPVAKRWPPRDFLSVRCGVTFRATGSNHAVKIEVYHSIIINPSYHNIIIITSSYHDNIIVSS